MRALRRYKHLPKLPYLLDIDNRKQLFFSLLTRTKAATATRQLLKLDPQYRAPPLFSLHFSHARTPCLMILAHEAHHEAR